MLNANIRNPANLNRNLGSLPWGSARKSMFVASPADTTKNSLAWTPLSPEPEPGPRNQAHDTRIPAQFAPGMRVDCAVFDGTAQFSMQPRAESQ
eukprot:2955347-Rhodomonas_salina.1